jgi:hypothetical protein
MESCYSDKARHSSGLLCRITEVMWNCAPKKGPELLSKNLFLHHENAPVNQALSVKSDGKASTNGL